MTITCLWCAFKFTRVQIQLAKVVGIVCPKCKSSAGEVIPL